MKIDGSIKIRSIEPKQRNFLINLFMLYACADNHLEFNFEIPGRGHLVRNIQG